MRMLASVVCRTSIYYNMFIISLSLIIVSTIATKGSVSLFNENDVCKNDVPSAEHL